MRILWAGVVNDHAHHEKRVPNVRCLVVKPYAQYMSNRGWLVCTYSGGISYNSGNLVMNEFLSVRRAGPIDSASTRPTKRDSLSVAQGSQLKCQRVSLVPRMGSRHKTSGFRRPEKLDSSTRSLLVPRAGFEPARPLQDTGF